MSDPRSSRFVRAMSAIGDLDSPHYADERMRYVWYEASAIAAQLYLWGGMAIATAMIWLGGRAQLGWSALVLGFTLAVAFCLVRYADAFRAPVEMTPTDLRSPEVIGVMLLLASYVVGVVFAWVTVPPGVWWRDSGPASCQA